MELTLCYRCKQNFEAARNIVTRVDGNQNIKEECDFCSRGRGYNYKVSKRSVAPIIKHKKESELYFTQMKDALIKASSGGKRYA